MLTRIKKSRWYKRWVKLLNQGLSPHQLSCSVALAVLIGLIPIIGVSTVLLTMVAYQFRLNVPVALFVSYVIAPIQILMIVPLIKLGTYLIPTAKDLTIHSVIEKLSEADGTYHLDLVAQVIGYGLIGWIVLIGPLSIVVYFLIRCIIRVYSSPASDYV